MIVEEAKRCLHDALWVVRNLLKEPKFIYEEGAVLKFLVHYILMKKQIIFQL